MNGRLPASCCNSHPSLPCPRCQWSIGPMSHICVHVTIARIRLIKERHACCYYEHPITSHKRRREEIDASLRDPGQGSTGCRYSDACGPRSGPGGFVRGSARLHIHNSLSMIHRCDFVTGVNVLETEDTTSLFLCYFV